VHPRKDSYRLHTEQLIHENRFHTEMRMSPDAVSKLIDILEPQLQRVEYNSRSEGPILPEHIVGVSLRTLAGGKLSDIRHIFKMSIAASYVCFNDFIDGVNTAPELAIKPPQSDEEWYRKNLGFLAKSSHRIMNCAALCVDGFFQRTNMPSLSEVTNQISYYSGHYESYGVNCLAVVFSDLQFAHFSVISAGCTNDNQSYPRDTELVALIDSMPQELYVSDVNMPHGLAPHSVLTAALLAGTRGCSIRCQREDVDTFHWISKSGSGQGCIQFISFSV